MTDRKGALQALSRCVTDLQAVQSILADGGYVGQPFALAVEELLGPEVQIAKRSELHTFAVMPQRWVPGDFAVVKRQSSLLGEVLEPSDFLTELENECRLKPGANKQGMGFLR